jgi:hypothetical protein
VVENYELHPIRWTLSLVLRAWLRRTSLVLFCYAIPMLAFAILAIVGKNDPDGWALLDFCVAAIVAFPVLWGLMRWRDQRSRDIRTVIGNWRLGSGDPATFAPAWIAVGEFASAQPLYGVDSFGDGAEDCIKIHNWWGAMFAARMCLLLEDQKRGLELTETILGESEVREAIVEVRSHPERWHGLLGPGRYQSN